MGNHEQLQQQLVEALKTVPSLFPNPEIATYEDVLSLRFLVINRLVSLLNQVTLTPDNEQEISTFISRITTNPNDFALAEKVARAFGGNFTPDGKTELMGGRKPNVATERSETSPLLTLDELTEVTAKLVDTTLSILIKTSSRNSQATVSVKIITDTKNSITGKPIASGDYSFNKESGEVFFTQITLKKTPIERTTQLKLEFSLSIPDRENTIVKTQLVVISVANLKNGIDLKTGQLAVFE
jgi:hypothetical protein